MGTLDRLERKKARTRRVAIPLDPDLVDAYTEVRLRYLEARQAAGGVDDLVSPDVRAAHEQAKKELEAASLVFSFRAIGRHAFDALVRAHPPTEAQKNEAKDTFGGLPRWNHQTFPQALIAHSLIDPKLTVAEVQERIFDSEMWNDGEISALSDAAIAVNTQGQSVDLGN